MGSVKLEYNISVSCMEFFIARKVRPVFEVYRQVFHKTTPRAQSHELNTGERVQAKHIYLIYGRENVQIWVIFIPPIMVVNAENNVNAPDPNGGERVSV